MFISSYGYWLLLVAGLWTLWFVVLCGERGWLQGVLWPWLALDPATRIVMTVLCAYCTVKAQKLGGTNESQTASQQESGLTSILDSSSLPQPQRPTAPLAGAQRGQPMASQEPSRIVLQSTLASDPAATPAFAGEPGWTAPTAVHVAPELDALSFDGAGPDIPSPVCFTNAPETTVQTVILAVRGNATNLATLADAPETARLRIATDGATQPDMTATERALTEALTPGLWQIAEIDFDQPTPLPELFFGGSAGRPAWRRNWHGEIAEAVGFNTTPDADARAGVANYLAIRWGIGGHPANAQQRQAAIDAGLNYGRTWGTAIFFK